MNVVPNRQGFLDNFSSGVYVLIYILRYSNKLGNNNNHHFNCC
jgi:hypothetical protein